MSCTLVAVPIALQYITSIFVVNAVAITAFATASSNKNDNNICEDVKIISEANFLEESLETPFNDKNILIKTLEEHGIQNVIDNYGTIKGELDKYSLLFEKENEQSPYKLKISYLKGTNFDNMLNDLHAEYSLNVQEESYLNLIEKLKENNMQIEEEEVLDDNTIVLTINLEN